jgi:hypothetical protein
MARKIATITIALGITVGAIVLVVTLNSYRVDRQEIWAIFEAMQIAERTGDYAAAYGNMSPAFRRKCSLAEFPSECNRMCVVNAPTLSVECGRTCATLRPSMWCGGAVLRFVKIDGRWYCVGVMDWYYD